MSTSRSNGPKAPLIAGRLSMKAINAFGPAFLLAVAWLSLSSLTAPVCAKNNPDAHPQRSPLAALTEGWVYRWSDPSSPPGGSLDDPGGTPAEITSWKPYDPKQPMRPKPGKLLWLKKTLNEANLPGAALFIPQYSAFRAFEVYLGKNRIYRSGVLHPAFINRHLYIEWHLIPLPSDYYGQTLRFRFFSDHPELIGLISTIYLGKISAIMRDAVLKDLDLTLLGLLMILAGLLGAALLPAYYRLKNRALLFSIVMAISAGFYIQTESDVTTLLFDHPVLLSYLHYVTFFLFAGGAWAFMEQTVGGSWKRFYRMGGLFQIAYLALAMLLDLLEILPWDLTFDAGMAFLGVFIAAAELGLLKMALSDSLEARILSIGYGVLGLSGAWDILAGLRVLPPRRILFPYGLVLLLVCLAIVLILRYRAERREVEETIRRSEDRFRNLFEHAPISIVEVDFKEARPMVIGANEPAAELFGLTSGEPLFLPLESFFSPESIAPLCRAVDSPASCVHTILESTCRRTGNGAFPARIGISPMQAFGPSRVVLTIQDITEEKERRSEEDAIAEERRRIAREIHDGLAQDLAVMNLKASVWPRLVEGRPEQMRAEIKLFQQLLKKNIREVRRCIFALRPVELEELGFFEAARRFVQEFGEQNQIEVAFEVAGAESGLPHRLEPVLFRIIQETLNNVRKHARAKTVRLDLTMGSERGIRLDIRDNGRGFDTSSLERGFREGHLGIRQMRERIERQRGSFFIESDEGEGTRIRVDLPLTV